jgi:hypothetical protein
MTESKQSDRVVHLGNHPEVHSKAKAFCAAHHIDMKRWVSQLVISAVEKQARR